MDCAYKNDGGGNVGFNVVDKILDPSNFCLEETSAQVSTKSSVSNPSQLEVVVTNGSNHFFQVECNGNESTNSEFSTDKQIVLLKNIINETNKFDTDLVEKATLDQPLLHESCERTAKRKCLDVEDGHQLNTVQSSQELKDLVLEESSGVDRREKGAINGELPKQKLAEIPQCMDNPSHDENGTLANPVLTNLSEVNSNEVCENAKLDESLSSEIGKNVVEEIHTSSDSGVNCQSVDTPFSSSENIDECVSDEEEVYLEVDEIGGESDQVSDVASEDENEEHATNSQIDLDCAETVDALIQNINHKEIEFKAPVEDAKVLTLSTNTLQHPDSQDEVMSEEEVYEEVEEDFDEELDLEVNDDNENAEVEMDVDSECVDSPLTPVKLLESVEKLKDDSVESRLDLHKIVSNDLKIVTPVKLLESAEKLKDGSVESRLDLDEVVSDNPKIESNTELERNVTEESSFNEKKSEDNMVKTTLESERVLDEDIPEDSKSEPDIELKDNVNEESHFNEMKSKDNGVKAVEGTLESEFALCEDLLESPKSKPSNESKESIDEDSHLNNQKDEDIDKNVVEETPEDEILVVDEDDDVEDDESMTEENKEEKLLNSSVDTEEKTEGNTKNINSVMNILKEVSGTVVTSKDQVTISNCKAQEDTEKMNVSQSPKKTLDGEDFDEEFESLIEEFVVTECANEDAKAETPKSEILVLESEDELEVIMEDFKAANSDDDCLIVEDTSKEVVINVDYECGERKNVGSGSSPLKINAKVASAVANVGDIPQKKSLATEEIKSKSSNIGINVKMKDAVDNSVSNATRLPVSEQASRDAVIMDTAKQPEYIKSTVDKSDISKLGGAILESKVGPSESSIVESISNTDSYLSSELVIKSQSDKVTGDNSLCVSNSTEQNSLANKSDFALVDKKLSFNCGLFSKECHEKPSLKNFVDTEKSIQASVKIALSNVLTKVCPPFSGTKDCNAKVKSVCDPQQNSDSVANNLEEVSRSKFSSISAQDENSEEENCQKTDMDEIIIDSFVPPEKAMKLDSSATDSSEKCIIKEDSKKRLFDELENIPSLTNTKKFKAEEIAIEIPYDSNSKVQKNIQEKILELIPQENSFKFVTTKEILDKIIKHVLAKSIQDVEPNTHACAKKNVDTAEEIFQVLDEDLKLFNVEVSNFVAAQDQKFQQKNFNPQVQTRTVGVNVKIFRECDLQHYSPAPASLSQNSGPIPCIMGNLVTNKASPPVPVSKPPLSSAVPPRPNIPTTSAASRPLVHSQQLAPARRPLAPAIVTNASRPRQFIPGHRFTSFSPNVTIIATARRPLASAIVTNSSSPRQFISGHRFTTVSPNVTIAGNPLATILTNTIHNRPPVSHPGSVPNRVQVPNSNRLIDLTGEGSINRRPATTIASVTPSSVSNANLPRLAGNQNVLVPLSNFFQMLPNTQNNPQFSTGTQLQMATGRHSILQPSIRPALGPRTVAYFMPSANSGQLANYGRGAIPMPPFLTGSNQRVQTIVVRVTNPGQATPLSTIVSSTPRMQAPSNSIQNSNTITTATNSGLVLIPQAANRHPAPFPQAPVYPFNSKLKVLPPQPALKGSRAPQQGIILSWNMNMQSSHADVSNYQLFAYQETSAMVTSALWKKVGDVKALPLPMACTLTQFIEGHRYYFTVRAVDIHGRFGKFSDPVTIMYSKQNDSQTSNK